MTDGSVLSRALRGTLAVGADRIVHPQTATDSSASSFADEHGLGKAVADFSANRMVSGIGHTICYFAMAAQAHSEPDVKHDIVALLTEVEIDSADFPAQHQDSIWRSPPCFNLNRELTETLIRKTCRVPAIPKREVRLHA